jgi:putative serine protease PepD
MSGEPQEPVPPDGKDTGVPAEGPPTAQPGDVLQPEPEAADQTQPIASSPAQPGTPVGWHHTSPQGWPAPTQQWYAGQPGLHAGAPQAEAHHPGGYVGGHPGGYLPGSGSHPAAPHAAAEPGPLGHQPARPQHHRPGWGALIGVALGSALVAGVLGGLGGGYLASNGYLDLRDDSSYSAPAAQPGSTSRPAGSVAGIAAKALPSVVTIEVRGADGLGTGSGFVFDRLGHLITNNHVVADASTGSDITVVLSSGKHVTAKLVGRDTSYDIAVLDVDPSGLAPLPIGSSSSVVVGDEVIAVGAPLGLESTVTSGIVSALNRPVSPSGGTQQSFINAIQTDAAINPGNSGGPLLDMQGKVIGVNSAIAAVPGVGQQSGNIGVGFAIPSDQVRKTAEQLIRTGKAVHPVIGVILDTEYTGEGVRIATKGPNGTAPVTRNGPADKAGIRPGDVVVEFEGRPMTDPDQLVVAIRAKDVGDVVTMKVRRGSREINVKMTLQGVSD